MEAMLKSLLPPENYARLKANRTSLLWIARVSLWLGCVFVAAGAGLVIAGYSMAGGLIIVLGVVPLGMGGILRRVVYELDHSD